MSIKENVKRAKTDYDEVYEAGRKSQYDEFWDTFQRNGNVSSANYMYANGGWNDVTFKPKHSQKYMTNCANIFNSAEITDLKGILERQGVTFDFSKCSSFTYSFAYSKLTRLPIISAISASSFSNAFYYDKKLKSVDEIILKDDGSQAFTNAFNACTELEEVRFSGVIGQDIDFKDCSKLSKASIESVITHLSDTASGKTATFSQTAVNNAFTTDEWNALIATKSNWTISLV